MERGDRRETEREDEPQTERGERGRNAECGGPEAGVRKNLRAGLRRLRELRLARGLIRYGKARGGVLAGGIAYSALFALAAALTIAWTVFMAFLGSDESLRANVLDGLNRFLPGVLKTGDGKGLIEPDSLILKSALTPASVVAALILLYTATSVVENIATSVRAMFGIVSLQVSSTAKHLRSLGGFSVLAIGIGASSALTVGFGVIGSILSFAIDVAIVAFIFRAVAGVRMPKRDLVLGSTAAAAGTTLLRVAEKSIVSSVAHNALLASFTVLAALLLGFNLASRILLVCAAVAANPPIPYSPVTREEIHATSTPNYVTLSAPHTLTWLHNPLSGSILPVDATDRITADDVGGTEQI